MNYKKIFVSAILAGCAIGFGGVVNLVLGGIAGALFFTVGLFVVCTMGLHLYTGKVCYVFENDKAYALSIPVIWLGNLVGTVTVGTLIRLTRIAYFIEYNAEKICNDKLSDNLVSIFILAALCNIFIYIGVEGFKNVPHEVGKYVALFLGVAVFILCSYEHCVANMFYFTVGGAWSVKAVGYLLWMTLGNAVGGVFFPLLRGYIKK